MEALLGGWSGKRVLVIGDVMLDRYLWGRVDRISPEAPVPVVDVESESVRLGGAANVADNVRALGGRPYLVGVTGEDAEAALLRERLAAASLSAHGLVPDRGRPTSVKTRIVARSHHIVRVDRESRAEAAEAAENALIEIGRAHV